MNIVWLDEVAEDLEKIYDFYYVKSPLAAAKIYNKIVDEAAILATHPFIAAIEPLLKDKRFEYRSLVTKDGLFKIVYYAGEGDLFITNIWCCRSDPKRLTGKYANR